MPINKDHRDLDTHQGFLPDKDPFIGRAIAKHWLAKNYSAEKAHAISGTKFRFSQAGGCTRSGTFYMAGTPETNPPSEADAWRMGLGTMVHDAVEGAILEAFPDANVEVPVHAEHINGSGHIDMVLDEDGKRTVVELKTINGFGFKMAATTFKGPPEGPRPDHVIQGALAAYELNADRLIIAYLAMENVSPSLAKYSDEVYGRFTAQWSFAPDEFRPIAELEHKRVKFMLDHLDSGKPPEDMEPWIRNDNGVAVRITNPRKGAWVQFADGEVVDAGQYWLCGYCRYQDHCDKTFPAAT